MLNQIFNLSKGFLFWCRSQKLEEMGNTKFKRVFTAQRIHFLAHRFDRHPLGGRGIFIATQQKKSRLKKRFFFGLTENQTGSTEIQAIVLFWRSQRHSESLYDKVGSSEKELGHTGIEDICSAEQLLETISGCADFENGNTEILKKWPVQPTEAKIGHTGISNSVLGGNSIKALDRRSEQSEALGCHTADQSTRQVKVQKGFSERPKTKPEEPKTIQRGLGTR